ncbi:MAG: glycosyltransferase family 4 protein [Armatimonadota bacterium]
MKVWVVKTGEPIPVHDKNNRWMRSGYLAKLLADNGHDVVWWTSTFDHFSKTHFHTKDTLITTDNGLNIRFVHSPGYSRHVSYARLKDHSIVASRFLELAETDPKPDIILCCLPTLELCCACVDYGKKYNIPVVIDVRDWWPDLYVYSFPKNLQWFARLLLRPMFRKAEYACSNAYAITGTTQGYVDWGLQKAKRQPGAFDIPFPLASADEKPSDELISDAHEFWQNKGVMESDGRPIFAYIGSLGLSFDIPAILSAARILKSRNIKSLFVLCGKGDKLEHYRKISQDLDNVVFVGWVKVPEIYTLLKMSVAGLAPLPDRPDFLCNINNKTIQYLGAGLPIISSPEKGVVADLLSENDCGVSYATGNPEQLADTIARLSNDDETRKRMSGNAIKLFNKEFIADTVYVKMIKYLEDIVNEFGK